MGYGSKDPLWGLWISFQSCKISLCSHVTGIGRSVACRTSDKRNFTKVFAFLSLEVFFASGFPANMENTSVLKSSGNALLILAGFLFPTLSITFSLSWILQYY